MASSYHIIFILTCFAVFANCQVTAPYLRNASAFRLQFTLNSFSKEALTASSWVDVFPKNTRARSFLSFETTLVRLISNFTGFNFTQRAVTFSGPNMYLNLTVRYIRRLSRNLDEARGRFQTLMRQGPTFWGPLVQYLQNRKVYVDNVQLSAIQERQWCTKGSVAQYCWVNFPQSRPFDVDLTSATLIKISTTTSNLAATYNQKLCNAIGADAVESVLPLVDQPRYQVYYYSRNGAVAVDCYVAFYFRVSSTGGATLATNLPNLKRLTRATAVYREGRVTVPSPIIASATAQTRRRWYNRFNVTVVTSKGDWSLSLGPSANARARDYVKTMLLKALGDYVQLPVFFDPALTRVVSVQWKKNIATLSTIGESTDVGTRVGVFSKMTKLSSLVMNALNITGYDISGFIPKGIQTGTNVNNTERRQMLPPPPYTKPPPQFNVIRNSTMYRLRFSLDAISPESFARTSWIPFFPRNTYARGWGPFEKTFIGMLSNFTGLNFTKRSFTPAGQFLLVNLTVRYHPRFARQIANARGRFTSLLKQGSTFWNRLVQFLNNQYKNILVREINLIGVQELQWCTRGSLCWVSLTQPRPLPHQDVVPILVKITLGTTAISNLFYEKACTAVANDAIELVAVQDQPRPYLYFFPRTGSVLECYVSFLFKLGSTSAGEKLITDLPNSKRFTRTSAVYREARITAPTTWVTSAVRVLQHKFANRFNVSVVVTKGDWTVFTPTANPQARDLTQENIIRSLEGFVSLPVYFDLTSARFWVPNPRGNKLFLSIRADCPDDNVRLASAGRMRRLSNLIMNVVNVTRYDINAFMPKGAIVGIRANNTNIKYITPAPPPRTLIPTTAPPTPAPTTAPPNTTAPPTTPPPTTATPAPTTTTSAPTTTPPPTTPTPTPTPTTTLPATTAPPTASPTPAPTPAPTPSPPTPPPGAITVTVTLLLTVSDVLDTLRWNTIITNFDSTLSKALSTDLTSFAGSDVQSLQILGYNANNELLTIGVSYYVTSTQIASSISTKVPSSVGSLTNFLNYPRFVQPFSKYSLTVVINKANVSLNAFSTTSAPTPAPTSPTSFISSPLPSIAHYTLVISTSEIPDLGSTYSSNLYERYIRNLASTIPTDFIRGTLYTNSQVQVLSLRRLSGQSLNVDLRLQSYSDAMLLSLTDQLLTNAASATFDFSTTKLYVAGSTYKSISFYSPVTSSPYYIQIVGSSSTAFSSIKGDSTFRALSDGARWDVYRQFANIGMFVNMLEINVTRISTASSPLMIEFVLLAANQDRLSTLTSAVIQFTAFDKVRSMIEATTRNSTMGASVSTQSGSSSYSTVNYVFATLAPNSPTPPPPTSYSTPTPTTPLAFSVSLTLSINVNLVKTDLNDPVQYKNLFNSLKDSLQNDIIKSANIDSLTTKIVILSLRKGSIKVDFQAQSNSQTSLTSATSAIQTQVTTGMSLTSSAAILTKTEPTIQTLSVTTMEKVVPVSRVMTITFTAATPTTLSLTASQAVSAAYALSADLAAALSCNANEVTPTNYKTGVASLSFEVSISAADDTLASNRYSAVPTVYLPYTNVRNFLRNIASAVADSMTVSKVNAAQTGGTPINLPTVSPVATVAQTIPDAEACGTMCKSAVVVGVVCGLGLCVAMGYVCYVAFNRSKEGQGVVLSPIDPYNTKRPQNISAQYSNAHELSTLPQA